MTRPGSAAAVAFFLAAILWPADSVHAGDGDSAAVPLTFSSISDWILDPRPSLNMFTETLDYDLFGFWAPLVYSLAVALTDPSLAARLVAESARRCRFRLAMFCLFARR